MVSTARLRPMKIAILGDALALHRTLGSVLHRVHTSRKGARAHLVHLVEAAWPLRHWAGHRIPRNSTRRGRWAWGPLLMGRAVALTGGEGADCKLFHVSTDSWPEHIRSRRTKQLKRWMRPYRRYSSSRNANAHCARRDRAIRASSGRICRRQD